MSSIDQLRQAVENVKATIAGFGSQIQSSAWFHVCSEIVQSRRPASIFVFGLLAGCCTIGVYTLAAAKKTDFEVLAVSPGDASNHNAVSTGFARDEGFYSHRKLLQTNVAKTGTPVYRLVECRHLPKERAKLVQVGISNDGLAVFRVMRGDYCIFSETSMTPPAAAEAQVAAAIARDARAERRFANVLPATPVTDRRSGMTANERYVCEKFGPACSVALAIQRAENLIGACEIYHYNTSDGTLDWGYFQINSVHLRRPGLNLRDLLDCKTNIDYAYRLFLEKGFSPWTTYTSGAYRKFLPLLQAEQPLARLAQALTDFRPMPQP